MMDVWLLSIVGIFAIMVVIFLIDYIFVLKYKYGYKIVELKLSHEEKMKKDEWERKVEWEKIISEKNEARKLSKEREEKVDKLWDDKDKTPQPDLNRVALLHLLLSGSNKEGVTPETLKKEVDKVKNTYEIIKDYVK